MSGAPVQQQTRAWRDLITEEAIEPDMPIIDAHHHIWPKPPVPGYEAYTIDDVLADKTSSGHTIVASVYVDSHANWHAEGPTALRPVGETAFVEAIAQACLDRGGAHAGACGAIVPHADLMLGGAVEAVLMAHANAAPRRFRGIRHMTVNDPDYAVNLGTFPGMMGTAAFREGFARLATLGLSYDAWVVHPQHLELLDLADRFPETTIVLGHVGGPIGIGRYAGERQKGFAEWRASLALLAQCPNISVKLGGMHSPILGLAGPRGEKPRSSAEIADAHREHQLVTIDLFGPERCMFESNFPVDRIWASATVVWNAFKRVTSDFTPAERAAMFYGVAARIYNPVTI